ncbi:MAG: DUF721 domain-containing protein [Bacteroidetes bacterium]|nr:DUF721 domain-containing protein [Bacteroidota bacterium]
MEISLGDALKGFINNSRLKNGVQAIRIKDAWEKIMGKTIANYTDDIQISNGTMFITTSVAPLKNELIYQKENIIKRVNELMGERIITEVIVK